jgi:hypothetical protein
MPVSLRLRVTAAVPEVAMLSQIRPSNPDLLTDLDVDYTHFHCCGDEDLVFLRCPRCGHMMVFCYECDTLYPDLSDTSTQGAIGLTAPTDRVVCSACSVAFEHHGFLMPEHVDSYLPTAQQVRDAGFGHLLAAHRR